MAGKNRLPKILAFGEIMMRMTPPKGNRLSDTTSLDICYGGSESNVMIGLSSLGDQTSFITYLPANDLGTAVERHLSRYKVNTDNIIYKGSTLGSYFVEEGFDALSSKVIYNRRYAEIAQIKENDPVFDFDTIFKDCDLFHICGISFALSENCQKLCFRLLEEAKKRNIRISFDFNYRGKLWSTQEAKPVFQKIIPYVDILFCAPIDLATFLDTTEKDFYNTYSCEYFVVRERDPFSSTRQSVWASIYHNQNGNITSSSIAKREFNVLERIGAGDAFCAGVLHKILQKCDDLSEILTYGISVFELKHFLRGDIFILKDSDVQEYMQKKNDTSNKSKDVNR